MATINQTLDADTATLVVEEFGHKVVRVSESDVEMASRACRRQRGEPGVAAAGRHRHGPRRPRQDLAARRDAQDRRRRRRGRRHHPAHRRLPGADAERRAGHLPRHAGPRGVHRDARPRRAGHRHRGAGRRGGRRRDAADDRGDQPRQGGGRADDRRDQQDRQERRRSRTGPHRNCSTTRSWSRRWAARCWTSRSRR